MDNEWNVDFLQNTSCVEKSTKTEAVFTKIEMYNEWKIHFLQNTSCVKKYWDLSCIYRNEQWMKHSFFF